MRDLLDIERPRPRPRRDTLDRLPAIMELVVQLGLDEADEDCLKSLHSHLVPHIDQIVSDFYTWACSQPGTGVILADEKVLAHVRKMLRAWLHSLLLGPRDDAYLKSRLQTGRRHLQVGLNPAYAFTGMNRIRALICAVIDDKLEVHRSVSKGWRNALFKALDLDFAIMMGGHHEADTLESLRFELEQTLREHDGLIRLGQRVAVVAHELKTPLAAISAAAQVLASRAKISREDAYVISEMLHRVSRLDQTVEGLLAYARPKAPSLTTLPLLRLVRDTVAAFTMTADSQIVTNIIGEEVEAVTDLNMLRAVLINLLHNADEAMHENENEMHDHDRHIEIELVARTDFVAIIVGDSGPGIPEEIRHKIFEPFFTTRPNGSGLGLPIARRMMRVLGGEVSADCPPSGGTRMTIHLPLDSPATRLSGS